MLEICTDERVDETWEVATGCQLGERSCIGR
jgi:hypothetical protein